MPDMRATGFGVVAVGAQGEVLAMAHGQPPEFVRNAPGAEAWGLHVVLSNVVRPPTITTDCLGLISQVLRGFNDALASRKPLARVWALIARSLDHKVPEEWAHRRFRWMPAHKARSAVGTALRSDGYPVSHLDWRANRLVDALAKLAAARNRTPHAWRRLLDEASKAVEYSAALLGLTTLAANNYTTTEWRNGGATHTLTRRDALPPAFLARGRGQRPGATGPRAKPPPQQPRPTQAADADAANDAAEKAALEEHLRARLDHQRAARSRARQQESALEDERDARALAAWHRDRAATPTPAGPGDRPSATERLAALRRRVAAKAAGN